jgi:FlaA1/EpsC-like NDP-sugar epimerase
LRPGEKLYEELLIGNNPQFTSHPRIMRANEPFMNWGLLDEELDSLRNALSVGDAVSAKLILQKLIPEYQSNSQIVDWVYVKKNHSIGN